MQLKNPYINKNIIKKNIIIITFSEKRNNIMAVITKSLIKINKLNNIIGISGKKKARQNKKFKANLRILSDKDKNLVLNFRKNLNFLLKRRRYSENLKKIKLYSPYTEYNYKNFYLSLDKIKFLKKVNWQKKIYRRNKNKNIKFKFYLKKLLKKNISTKINSRNQQKSNKYKRFLSNYLRKKKNIKMLIKVNKIKRLVYNRKTIFKYILSYKKKIIMEYKLSKKLLANNFPVRKLFKFYNSFMGAFVVNKTHKKMSVKIFFKFYIKFIHKFKLFLKLNGYNYRNVLSIFSSNLKKRLNHKLHKNLANSILFDTLFFPYLYNSYKAISLKKLYKDENYIFTNIKELKSYNYAFSQSLYAFENIKYPIEEYVRNKIIILPNVNNRAMLKTQSLLKFITAGNLGFKNRHRKLFAASQKLGKYISYYLSKHKYNKYPLVFVIRSKISKTS